MPKRAEGGQPGRRPALRAAGRTCLLTEDDPGILYDFFKTLAPIENEENPFPDAEPAPAPKIAGG
jgi:hypothetical protein